MYRRASLNLGLASITEFTCAMNERVGDASHMRKPVTERHQDVKRVVLGTKPLLHWNVRQSELMTNEFRAFSGFGKHGIERNNDSTTRFTYLHPNGSILNVSFRRQYLGRVSHVFSMDSSAEGTLGALLIATTIFRKSSPCGANVARMCTRNNSARSESEYRSRRGGEWAAQHHESSGFTNRKRTLQDSQAGAGDDAT